MQFLNMYLSKVKSLKLCRSILDSHFLFPFTIACLAYLLLFIQQTFQKESEVEQAGSILDSHFQSPIVYHAISKNSIDFLFVLKFCCFSPVTAESPRNRVYRALVLLEKHLAFQRLARQGLFPKAVRFVISPFQRPLPPRQRYYYIGT